MDLSVCCLFVVFRFGDSSQRLIGSLGSPYERDCYLGVPLEAHTTIPNHQFTIPLPETNSSPLKICFCPKRKLVFQP